MRTLLLALAVLFIATAAHARSPRAAYLSGGQPLNLAPDEEFVGPLAGWQDVTQSPCNASNGGSVDATSAIQTCINARSSSSPVLWFPAGTYKISSTLTFPSATTKIQFLCQDPTTTMIKWAGSGSAMMLLTDVTFSKFSRCTFDGNGTASMIIDSDAGGNLNTGNEWSDTTFQNAAIAFRCGHTTGQCAEQSMYRDQFLNLTVCGIAMQGANALDMWVWYGNFVNNIFGISNFCASGTGGNFTVYKSKFADSATADAAWGNTQFFGLRWNYSVNSNRFASAGGTTGGDNVVIQGNTILNTDTTPIIIPDAGPLVLIDNIITELGTTVGPVVTVGNSGPPVGELFSMTNTFTASSPTQAAARSNTAGDAVVGSVSPPVPVLPPVPPNRGRTVFEVSASGSGSTGCTAISPCQLNSTTLANAAAAGSKTVVHLRAGTYSVGSTLNVPASDIQIIGDESTSLNASSLAGAPVLKLASPSKVVMRDFFISGQTNSADGIEIDGADQSGARVFIDEPTVTASSLYVIFSDQLDHTTVEVHNHELGNNFGTSAFYVHGGALGAAGDGQTNIFNGQDAGSHVIYTVDAGGKMVATDCFCGDEQENIDQTAGHAIGNFSGGGAVAISGGFYSRFTAAADTAVKFSNFTGQSSITGARISGETLFTGSGTGGQNAGLGMINERKMQGFVTASAIGSFLLHYGVVLPVGNGQWISDFLTGAAIPTSLITPTTVSSFVNSPNTVVTMSQAVVSPGVTNGDLIWNFAPVTYAQSDGSTLEYLNPLTNYFSNTNQNPQELPQIGSASLPFLTSALAILRNTQPVVPTPLPSGITDVRLYRIAIDQTATAIHIKH